MKCSKCGKETFETTTTDVTDVDNCLFIVRNVPCHECEFCGEVFYTGGVVRRLEELTAIAKSVSSEISVVDYKKCREVA